MKKLFKQVGALAIVAGLMLGVGASYAGVAQATLRVVQTPTYHLYSGESGAASTMRITPYPTDLDGVKLTMTDFGTSPTVTVDPKISGYEEIESFTGITDNGDNTATLSGVSRDLASKYPYTTAGTGKTHGAGATVVFGNNPQIYGRLAALENAQTWTSVQTFGSTTQPAYDATPLTWASQLSLVDKAYVDSGLLNGAATSTFANQGLVWLASPAQIAAGTASSTTGSPLVIGAGMASSTFNAATAFLGEVISLRSTKDIDPNFIATSTGSNYTWGGAMTMNATTTVNAGLIASSTTVADASTINVDWGKANTFTTTIAATGRTVTFSDVAVGESIKVLVCQDSSGSRTVTTWPAAVRWASGFAPTLTTTANKCDVISFFTATSTATIYGAATMNF